MALIETLTDDFSGTLSKWTAAGTAIVGGTAAINVSQNAGAAVYSSLKSATGYTWQGSSLRFQVTQMPAVAGTSNANAQFWVTDPAPAATVDRLGFEYVCSSNSLVLRGQTGAGYAAIGTDVTLTYSATNHAWLRIDNTGSAIVWYTSADGVTWTAQRTYNTVPTWANKTTLLADFEGFRTSGTNDTVRVDNVNLSPAAAQTITIALADEVEDYPAGDLAGVVALDVADEVEESPDIVPVGTIPIPIAEEVEETLGVTATGVVTLDVADEVGESFDVTIVWIATLDVADEVGESPMIYYAPVLPVAEEVEFDPPVAAAVRPRTYVPGGATDAGFRVIAQELLSGRFLDWELPVADLSLTSTLSGPQAVTGKLRPHLPRVAELNLRPWNTWLHCEDDYGQIRGSAILLAPFGVNEAERSIESAGVSTYPNQVIYEGSYAAYNVDPLDVVRLIWTHVQSFPDSHLGVQVSANTSTVRVGGYQSSTAQTTGPRVDDFAPDADGDPKPYALNWWEQSNCGQEIDQLAKNVPFDYVERQSWNAAKTGVDHFIDLGYPRIGLKRTDLRFAQDENIIGAVPVAELDDSYVTDIRITGAGEGSAMILGQASRRGTQLRRVAQINEKTVKSTARAKAIADATLLRRTEPRGISTLLIDAYHENAPYGSFQCGDDILVQVEVDWIGEIRMWHRVLEQTFTPEEASVALKLAPSSSFRYGASA